MLVYSSCTAIDHHVVAPKISGLQRPACLLEEEVVLVGVGEAFQVTVLGRPVQFLFVKEGGGGGVGGGTNGRRGGVVRIA